VLVHGAVSGLDETGRVGMAGSGVRVLATAAVVAALRT